MVNWFVSNKALAVIDGQSDGRLLDAEPVPFVDLAAQQLRLAGPLDVRIRAVLAHGRYIMGPEVFELEAALAERTGARHVITCSSGTDALLMALMAWGIGPGDAVFVPTFTFTATAEVVALLGATPVFCDVDPRRFNLDATSLEAALTAVDEEGTLRPAAVIPVDLFGQPADYSAIAAVVGTRRLKILADAAQSFGASVSRRKVGTFGDATATSFFPAKPLGCYGDGGAIFTDDDAMAETLRSLRVHGKGSHKYDAVRVGLTARLDTIQAAVLLAKLDIFDEELATRQQVANSYTESLKELVTCPDVPDGTTSAWAQYTIALEGRDDLAQALRGAGIPTAIYYPTPIDQQPAYSEAAGQFGVRCSIAADLATKVLSIPMGPYLSRTQQRRVVSAIERALSG